MPVTVFRNTILLLGSVLACDKDGFYSHALMHHLPVVM